MKKALFVLAVLVMGLAAMQASAVPGDCYILPIDHRDGGNWTLCAGGGYVGTDAWCATGMDGLRRVYWSLSNVYWASPGAEPFSATVKLYSLQWFRPYCDAQDWQPIESQMRGVNGETYPMDPDIPWAGAFGTNHQYIGTNTGDQGTWVSTGPGPHTPQSPYDYNAGANGDQMWLKDVSWIYAKWDYSWDISHCWSMVMLTECPEPSSFFALLAGIPALALLRRRR